MKSIRMKLFLGISGLIAFFVLFSWFLSTEFLNKYYIYEKKNLLLDTNQKIDELYKEDSNQFLIEVEKLERNTGIHIIIFNKDGRLKYSFSFNQGQDSLIFGKINLDEVQSGKVYINISTDPRLGTGFINSIYLLNNGDYLFLSTPLEAIKESAQVASQFSLFTGIATFIIGCIISLIFARKITNPILELNKIAQNMSNLDFSEKYIVNTNDEIGELGESINSLSNQLDKSITELKEANTHLMEDLEQKEKIDEMRKEFISNVSHELKTPISLIQGYAEGLKVNVIDDEESKNYYCDVIIDESDRMNKMVKELLDLSKIESGYLKLDKSVFDITILVKEVICKFGPILSEKNIRIKNSFKGNIFVNADKDRIEQVLINYLSNAIYHVNENKLLKINIEIVDNTVKFTVFNTGDQIPEESLDKIWTSFYKIDKARTREYGGTGLGLSIVRAIIDLHDGKYGVENKEDGVEFWFTLEAIEN